MVFSQHEFHPVVQQIQMSKMARISETCPFIGLTFCFGKAGKKKKKKVYCKFSTNGVPLLIRQRLSKLPHCHLV